MPAVFTHTEYADIVFIYGYCNGSALAAVAEYRRRFPNRRIPTKDVFVHTFNSLRERGMVPSANIVSERANRQPANEEVNILEAVERSPTTSTRRISVNLNVPRTRVQRTLHRYGLHPYHLLRVQHLHPGDAALRLAFCQWIHEHRRLIPKILFTDEAMFTRDGITNTHNNHVWSDENPHATVESHFQHRFSVNVWSGIIDNVFIGPVIFHERLTGARYRHFLEHELPGLLEDVPLATRHRMYYQHDGAPPHTARVVTQYLDEIFPGRWIGRGGPILWPPRSPDLTPMDYSLWGWFKSDVYRQKPLTRDDLIARIFIAATRIRERQDSLHNITRNLRERVVKCVNVQGGIFEHLMRTP